ncbi:MAG: hypothetical protein ABIR37_01105 [Candidatus Saccharimonadales bacterium]
MAGIFMVFLGNAAKAADYVVTATVPAPIPSGAPVITAPPDGTTIPTPAATVSGTCPVVSPPIIITLNDDTSFLGSQECAADGSFNIPITLSPGVHHITATVTTITGGTGQSSQPITITYSAPIVPASSTTPTKNSGTPAKGGPVAPPSPATLEILSDTPFIVFGATTDAIWRGSFAGGTPPYRVSIDWGDGSQDAFINRSADKQAFSHHYNRLKSYRVTVRVSDSGGQSVTRVIAAISPATFNHPPTGVGTISSGPSLTLWMYVLYISLFLMMLLFWRYEQLLRRVRPVPVLVPMPKRRRSKDNRR